MRTPITLLALLVSPLFWSVGCATVRVQNQDPDPPIVIVSSIGHAYKVAREIADNLPWKSDICKIWNTGSMWPTLDSGCLAIRSQIPYSMIQLGDIVHRKDDHGTDLVHRLVEKIDDKFLTRGDANPSKDKGMLSKESYSGTIVAIVRFRKVPYRQPISLEQLRREEYRAEILREQRIKSLSYRLRDK